MRLRDETVDYSALKERLRRADSSQRFFSGNPEWPKEDFYCALDLDRFDYAMKAVEIGGKKVLIRA
jgi:hypothetical protein